MKATISPRRSPIACGLPIIICALAVLLDPASPSGTAGAQEESLVDNGDFDLRAPDGWVEGWERVLSTADCQVEAAPAEGGNPAVKITGTTKNSKASLKTTLKPFEGPPALRVGLVYRGTKGERYVVIRAEGLEEGEEPVEQQIVLPPSQQFRPGGGMVTLSLAEGAEPERFVIELVHEGRGETWFDHVSVAAGEPAPRPAEPGLAPVGPYVTSYFPEDGATVSVSPPRLRWPAKPGATYSVQWSTSPDFPPEATERAEGLKLNLYIPAEPLAPGTWYWRVTQTARPGPTTPLPTAFDEEEEWDETGDEPGPTEGEDEAAIEEPEGEEIGPQDAPGDQPPPKKPKRKKGGRDGANESLDGSSRVFSLSDGLPLELVGQGEPEEEAAPEGEAPGPVEPETDTAPEDLGEPPAGLPGIDLRPPGAEGPHAPEPAESVSATRTFRVEATAAVVPVPPTEAIVADLPPHPRIWLTADSVVLVRALAQGALKARWDGLAARLDGLKGQELPEEPKGRGKWRKVSPKQLEANEEILRVAVTEAGLVRDFAFAALVTGDQSYAEEAKRRALHLAAWDAEGSTGYTSHDQAFREILLGLSLAIDWLSQSLSEEETQKIAEAVSGRGEILYKALSQPPRPLNAFPYSSHGQTALGFLTVAALSVTEEVPEAGEWLEFALPTAVSLFSPWAGDDGGWMQGETYWKRSAPYTFQLFDALQTAADIDLYALPWTQRTARYKAYMHPPYSTRGGFGDGPEAPPDANDRLAALRLASARKDALAAWYAASIGAPDDEPTAFDLLWHDPDVQAEAPEALPPSAAFRDSGLFAMHSSLTDPRGVHLYGRASAFGSFNHAHADQNHFSLQAFGQPLLIDAGYYDWYRSPHGTSFSRTTLAHNTLLVNDKVGQRPGDITAEGSIESFLASKYFDYASTEAAQAYPRAALKTFRRRFIFCRPNCIVIWDRVEAGQKASYTWLLHSLQEPSLDTEASLAVVRQAEAGVVIGAYGPEALVWKTTSRFPQNPRFTEEDAEASPQWHTSLATKGKAESEDLLLVLAPFEGEAVPEVKPLEVEGGKGAEAGIGGAQIASVLRLGEAQSVSWGDMAAEADCVVTKESGGEPAAVFAIGLKSLKRGEAVLIASTAPCLVAGALGEKPSLIMEPSAQATLTIACPTQPAKLLIDGEEQAPNWAEGLLTVELSAERHELAVE